MSRRWRIIAAIGGATAVVAALVIWLAWPDPPMQPREPRERAYRDVTACLLTDDQGLQGDPAKAAWSGLQDASLTTAIKVQYLAITGPQTPTDGVAYFNTLAMQQCAVIVAAGPLAVDAMLLGRDRFPEIRCVAVGATAEPPVTNVPGSEPEAISTAVSSIVVAVAGETD